MSDPITRLNATLEGRYRIERELGEGGMATVYLADDLKHERKVALKVLKPELAAVVGAERFLAEIKTTANLQHPHILPLFDSGEADSFLFYVMPYVEGETVRDRLDREHQLPVADAVQIAKDVAEALAYAHGHGVIHRDIKPANILIHSGRPVISDFGIALAVGVAGGGRLTETGLSLGTPHYMSPEQATGDTHVGPATDIYALGCVLYEMLVGEPPYTGSTPQAVLGKIIVGEADPVSKHRRSVPPNVESSIAMALEKVPADRFQSAQDLARALSDKTFGPSFAVSQAAADGQGRWRLVAMGASVLAAVLAFALVQSLTGPDEVLSRWSLSFSESEAVVDPLGLQSLGISPDGSAIVYTGPADAGAWQLHVRYRDALRPEPIAGTEGGFSPALSPDGERVAYLTGDGAPLYIVDLDGRTAPRLVTSANDAGLHWDDGGFLHFQDALNGLSRVSASGGEPEQFTRTDFEGGETRHRWPHVLPGGGVVFTILREDGALELGVVVPGSPEGHRRLGVAGTSPQYAATGHLVWATAEGSLMAARFDAEHLQLEGPAAPLPERVAVGATGAAQFAVSRAGTLVYRTPGGGARLDAVWVDRGGLHTAVDPAWQPEVPLAESPAISPTGDRIAVTLGYSGGTDIWIREPGGRSWPITFAPTERHGNPSWTAAGDSVLYTSRPAAGSEVWIRSADGDGTPELVLRHESPGIDAELSSDGSWLVFTTAAGGRRDIWALRRGVDTVGVPVATNGRFDERAPALSPDGRLLAYVSDEPGRDAVYVVDFPSGSRRRLVSIDGGTEPVWAPDGTELFYRDPSSQLIAVTDPLADLSFSAHERLFAFPDHLATSSYDVSPDGQRFIFLRVLGAGGDSGASELIWVDGWFSELRELVPK